MSSPYASLEAHFGRIGRLEGAVEMLYWDMAAMMPPGGANTRAEQLATLCVLGHELGTDPRLSDWLDAAEAEADALDHWQRANLVEMRRNHTHAMALPSDLVEAMSKAGSACEMKWRQARGDNDFAGLKPLLEEVIALTTERATVKAEVLGCSPYEALLDENEPGGKTAHIDALFDDLAAFLPAFTEQVLEHQARGPALEVPEGPFAVEEQRELGLRMMKTLGFDFEHGRLDVSHHPFCGGGAGDVRITTRYRKEDFLQSLMGVIHETGHALYEFGLPEAWHFQPVGKARGMGLHESQSLLMEMQACRSRQFIDHMAPTARQIFGGQGSAWSADNLHRLTTRVERGLIRVDADEVTYPAHVILRYRLEKAMLTGDLKVAELPGAWREGMLALVGIAPPDDKDGCMQDIHWMDGAVGYFPTYTLGAMTAAQLFDAAVRAEGAIMPGIAEGDFGPLLGWLRTHVHAVASSRTTDELLTAATGRPLDVEVFKAHLTRRYLS